MKCSGQKPSHELLYKVGKKTVLTGHPEEGKQWTLYPVMKIFSSSCFPRKRGRGFGSTDKVGIEESCPHRRVETGPRQAQGVFWDVGGTGGGSFTDASSASSGKTEQQLAN